MKKYLWYLVVFALSYGLTGCDPEGSNDGDISQQEKMIVSQEINITSSQQTKTFSQANTVHLKVNIQNSPKDLYILLSNGGHISSSPNITLSSKISETRQNKILAPSKNFSSAIRHAPLSILTYGAKLIGMSTKHEYQGDSKKIMTFDRQEKYVGDTHTFYLDEEANTNTTDATLKKVVSDVETRYGKKTLNIWVSNDSFGSSCIKKKCVTQSMVDDLANHFLVSGSDNDIYDWVTNIFGEEWGGDAQSNSNLYIGENDVISILVTDIGRDNSPNGGVIGYFYPKDNVKRSVASGSNERLMFYIDSVMLANEDTSETDWRKEIYSTLAHEFQHMIHFYQKAIKRNMVDDTWINEMLSEATEDAVATKINHSGPRGVEPSDGSAGDPENKKGRYPLFNSSNTRSLTVWNNDLKDYSKVSAFGTFLTRNYGGVKVLHDILYNNKRHEDAIEAATGKPFRNLLREWGTAVMLSDAVRPTSLPTYNTGDFMYDIYGNSTYKLGSINFFNYTPEPSMQETIGVVRPQANYYYKVGEGLSGSITIDIDGLNGMTDVTLITK